MAQYCKRYLNQNLPDQLEELRISQGHSIRNTLMTTEQIDNGSGKITYTVRELLAEIKSTLSNIDAKLDQKADRTAVEGLAVRVQTLETYGSPQVQKEMARVNGVETEVQ